MRLAPMYRYPLRAVEEQISWNQKEEASRDQYTLGEARRSLLPIRYGYYRLSIVFKLPMGNRYNFYITEYL